MNELHTKGAMDDVAGRVQSAAGAVEGDPTTELRGKARAARGRLEGAYGDAVDAVSHARQSVGRTIESNPMIAVGVALAAGFLLGWSMERD